MKTEALRQALDTGKFDAAIGGARRDEEKSRAKERIFSHRSAAHVWDPRNQRPELWNLFNTQLGPGESMRVFPLSNWTELDVWEYIAAEDIPIVPLYLAQPRPVVERAGTLIVVDDDRLPLLPDERPRARAACASARSAAIRCPARSVRPPRPSTTIIAEIRRRTPVGTAGTADRSRRGRLDGEEEARGLLLMRPRLRLLTCGSVDDGKSTLIGRLLHDAGLILDDQLDALADATRASTARPATSSTSRCCSTGSRPSASRASRSTSRTATSRRARRAFIVADTPGHEQYTRNMATGASNCRARRHPGRRPQGPADPDAAPRDDRLAARHPPRGAGGEQDGPGRISSSRSSTRSSTAFASSPRR